MDIFLDKTRVVYFLLRAPFQDCLGEATLYGSMRGIKSLLRGTEYIFRRVPELKRKVLVAV